MTMRFVASSGRVAETWGVCQLWNEHVRGALQQWRCVAMTTARERVVTTLAHRRPDIVPLDLGGSDVTGMHVDSVYRLRRALKLDPPGTPVKIVEPFQLLGEIKEDLLDALGVDVVSLAPLTTIFGFRNEHWKPWSTFAGTPVLVPEGFNTEPEPNGDILMYPCGDKSVPPCARMPAGGLYLDALTRQDPIDDDCLRVEDNLEEFTPISAEDLAYLRVEAERLEATARAVVGQFLSGFGHTKFRRHRCRARARSSASQGYPGSRRVVHEPRFEAGLHTRSVRAPV